MKKLEPATDN